MSRPIQHPEHPFRSRRRSRRGRWPSLAVTLAVLLAPLALGSGSIGGGSGGISQYGQLYKQGKMVFFHKLACSRAECPIKRNQVNSARAARVIASIEGAADIRPEESPYDEAVSVLTADERKKLRYYLARRFRIDS